MSNINLNRIVQGEVYKMLATALNETAIRFTVPRVNKLTQIHISLTLCSKQKQTN
jgi:hypothetical protein